MKKIDLEKWRDKNERLNENETIGIGDMVWDGGNCHGIVVELYIPENPTIEDHGGISIWQDRRDGYGIDNCEHYTWFNWKRYLRIELKAKDNHGKRQY